MSAVGPNPSAGKTVGRKTADPACQLIRDSQEWETKSQPDEKKKKSERSEVDGATELCNYCRPGDFIRRHGPVFAGHCRNTADLQRSAKSEGDVTAFPTIDSFRRL